MEERDTGDVVKGNWGGVEWRCIGNGAGRSRDVEMGLFEVRRLNEDSVGKAKEMAIYGYGNGGYAN